MEDAKEQVILVDEQDNSIGLMDKLEAHRSPILHRAFSVFVVNPKKEILLQQRAASKYHSPLLWTNSCCSHPRDGESVIEAAVRRTYEELNIEIEPTKKFDFIYQANLGDNLFEHEFDHILFANFNGDITGFNTNEVNAVKWVSLEEIEKWYQSSPEELTVWFKILLEDHLEKLKQFL